MCLETIDKKPKKHDVGYKIFKENVEGKYETPIIEVGSYRIGKTYNAKIHNDPLPKFEIGIGRQKYKAGFHYYLKMKDAKKVCGDSEVVIRIKVKNILATGSQFNHDCGVSQYITLDKIVFEGEKEKLKQEKAEYKKFLKICKRPVESKLLRFAKKFNLGSYLLKGKDLKEITDFISDSTDEFVNYMSFIDFCPRQSKTFLFFTKIHIWAYQNHRGYKDTYTYVVKNVHKLQKELYREGEHEILLHHCKNVDKFILEKI